MDLTTVKFVNIYQKDKKGKNIVADIPITRPQKIRAYIDMGDLQPKNAANNDHGWRIAPELAAKIRETLEDPIRLEEISKQTTTPLDLINAFHVLMYEITRNRQLALRAAQNSLDKEQATSEYEREVAAARSGKSDDSEDDEKVPAPGTGKNY
jgi:hypothetical protein